MAIGFDQALAMSKRYPSSKPTGAAPIGAPGTAGSAIRAQQVAATAPADASTLAQGGGALAQAAGQERVQTAAQNAQALGQVAQVGAAGESQQTAQALSERKTLQGEDRLTKALQLANLDESAKDKLLAERMKFASAQLGDKALTDSQLLDWARTKARSGEDFKDKAQTIQQASKRKIQMLEIGYKKLEQTLKDESEGRTAKLNQGQRLKLAEAKAALERRIAKDKANAAARAAVITGVFTVAGTAVGGPVGGAIGAGLGQTVAGATAEKPDNYNT